MKIPFVNRATGQCLQQDEYASFQQLAFLSELQAYIPSLSMHTLSSWDKIEATIVQCFYLLPNQCDKELYSKFQHRIKQLRGIEDLLSCLPILENRVLCFPNEDKGQSSVTISALTRNLHRLQQHIFEIRMNTQDALFRILDDYPDKTGVVLNSMINSVWLFVIY